MTISSEVLPDPLGPTTAMDSPGATARSTPLRISTGPARLVSVSETSREGDDGFGHDSQSAPAGACPELCKFLLHMVT